MPTRMPRGPGIQCPRRTRGQDPRQLCQHCGPCGAEVDGSAPGVPVQSVATVGVPLEDVGVSAESGAKVVCIVVAGGRGPVGVVVAVVAEVEGRAQ